MIKFSLLELSQVTGDKKLCFFGSVGSKCAVTDYAILLGANPSSRYINDSGELKDRTVEWVLKTSEGGDYVSSISEAGFYTMQSIKHYSTCVRPSFKYNFKNNEIQETLNSSGSLKIEYGQYPQMIADLKTSQKLEKELANKRLKQSGKKYVINCGSEGSTKLYDPREIPEYKYNGKTYVRILGNNRNKDKVLSDGRTIKKDKPYWIEVEPVRWLIDKDKHIALSKKVLLSGVQFDIKKSYNNDFKNTILGKHLDNFFAKEVIPISKPVQQEEKNEINKNNYKLVYDFDFNYGTEEDIIKASLESNLAPFLHGKSSEGKSARIKQFDPNAEIVYLRNATPDSLNGKSVYDSKNNQMIDVPPTWYIKLKEKCEKEPDKLHIVFFDELTNALPSIQGMAFNIILDKEINGKWKLPENARVAAAGNDLEDSLAANTMAEPLFNRFNHVYINTTVDDWLKWALTPNDSYERLEYKNEENNCLKIHPAIYTVIYSERDSALRTPYNGITPNADPRKWEMASKVLYKTNNPYMLRGLIGKDLTDDFVKFYQRKVITLEDVLSGDYDRKVFKMDDWTDKYLTVLSLSKVDLENFDIAREFVEHLGQKPLKLFDSLWAIGNKERLEYINNLDKGNSKVKKL